MRAWLNLFLVVVLVNVFSTPAISCTIAVVSGSATIDGRPLLWKNRDVNDHNQEVRYFDDGSFGGYLALVTTGDNETTTSYVGLNEAGLAIMNSVSPDLLTGYPSSHGILMKRALRECGTVDDFEALLISTSGNRGNIWANFGVIDALGEAAIFEATNTDYVRYDATDEGGYIVRANNSIWGGGDLGSRYYTAQQLVSDGAAAEELSREFFIQTVAPDLGDTPSMPCGQWPAQAPALNRHQTRSSVVVHGVLPGEDSRLSTFWCTLGEPTCGISVPLWAYAGTPPLSMGNPGNQAAMCGAIQEKENYCYSSLSNDTTIDTEALVGANGNGGIHAYSLPIETGAFADADTQLESWRQLFPLVEDITEYQLQSVTKSLLYFNQESYPDAANLNITQVTPGPINCSGSTVLNFNLTTDQETPDVFLYNVEIQASAEVMFGTIVDLLPFTDDSENFFTVNNGGGSWTITGSTIADPNHTHPISDPGTVGLFAVEFSGALEGLAEITFGEVTLRDPNNSNIPHSATGSSIVVDCTAPLAVAGITAKPHHNRVEVTWSHDGTDVDHYEVFSGLWHDGNHVSVYPEYDDVIGNTAPTRPADYAAIVADISDEWDGFISVAALTADQTWDPADRGVYYYEVYAVDAAGNASSRADANDRATNYWLGDMDDSGSVVVYDMGFLGAAFGTSSSDGTYQPDADVGPTVGWSRFGIPTTDNLINFEDLMIFSMNFGMVSPTNKSGKSISRMADLSWVKYDEGVYALRLNNASGLKGVHLRANVPEGTSVGVTAGILLDQQSEMTFLRNIGKGLDINLAITGSGVGFAGQGDLFVVECAAELTPESLVLDLRGSDNSSIGVNLDSDSSTLTPRVFGLYAAYPNPFNPMTKISFSLAASQDVLLRVYGIDGKHVATLVNETRGAGLHEVVWDGRDDAGQFQASGTYFYRIEAGMKSSVRKMTLMK